ncbi:hypothetical protein [Streptomyces sp. NPDC093544]
MPIVDSWDTAVIRYAFVLGAAALAALLTVGGWFVHRRARVKR